MQHKTRPRGAFNLLDQGIGTRKNLLTSSLRH